MNTVLRKKGFTLIELLTVIIIIALLLTILVPAITTIMKMGSAAKCKARISAFESTTMAYFATNGSLYYPGQQNVAEIGGAVTGSQVLARTLFTNSAGVYKGDGSPMPYDRELVISDAANPGVLSDGFSSPKAVCYYVSRPRAIGLSQYVSADNSTYTGTNDAAFNAMIKNKAFSTTMDVPYKDRQFLLIAPGPDGIYFTNDDITNWN